jgi:hypothetical protein
MSVCDEALQRLVVKQGDGGCGQSGASENGQDGLTNRSLLRHKNSFTNVACAMAVRVAVQSN